MPPVSRNTPRGGDLTPFSFEVESFAITNERGELFDLVDSDIVESFAITEDIMSPLLTLSMRIRESVNFFDDFGLSGQEVIEISIRKRNKNKSEDLVKLRFSVKEYPTFTRETGDVHTQVYTLVAISPHAYLSALKRVSRSVRGNPVDNIKDLFANDMLGPEVVISGDCVSDFKGILTTQSPLKAVEFLRARSFDKYSSPFFVYHRAIDDTIRVQSWVDMINDSIYPYDNFKYEYIQRARPLANSEDSWDEKSRRILSLTSNLKLDKLQQAMRGGFSNTTEVIDISTKSFDRKTWSVFNPISQLSKSHENPYSRGTLSSNEYRFASRFHELASSSAPLQDLASMSEASIISVPDSSLAGGGVATPGSVLAEASGGAAGYIANAESMTHTIQVAGDFNLSPGRKIFIDVPIAANPENYESDSSISGEYIISMASHMFANGRHTTTLKIIKDNA